MIDYNHVIIIELRHNILIQCQKNCIELEKIQLYAWNWHYKELLTWKMWVPWGVIFEGLGV